VYVYTYTHCILLSYNIFTDSLVINDTASTTIVM
jgi:hypothetical protein